MVLWSASKPQNKIPSQLGVNKIRLDGLGHDCLGEYSGFWFQRVTFGTYVCLKATQWAKERIPNAPIYAVFEKDNRVIKRVYTKLFGLLEMSHPPISYEGFTEKLTGRPVQWQLTVDQPGTRMSRIKRVSALEGVARIEANCICKSQSASQ